MHCCNWQLLFALLLLTILYASLQLTMFVCIIFLLHFLNVPLEMTFLVCPSFELLKLPTFEWLQQNVFMDYFEWHFVYASLFQLTPFCMHCCTNFFIHYCYENPLYIDNFYIAKPSPSPSPSSIGLLYFHLILPLTHRPDQPPTRPENFLRHN